MFRKGTLRRIESCIRSLDCNGTYVANRMKVRNSSENLVPRPTFAFAHDSTAVGRNDLGLILNPRCPPGAPCGAPVRCARAANHLSWSAELVFAFFQLSFVTLDFSFSICEKGLCPWLGRFVAISLNRIRLPLRPVSGKSLEQSLGFIFVCGQSDDADKFLRCLDNFALVQTQHL
jgi:hypothetical protein